MKKVLGIVAVLFLLVGCGGKTSTTICKGLVGQMDLENEITSSGDKVSKTTETGAFDFTDLAPSNDEIEQFVDLISEQYDDLDGIEFDYKIKDEKLTFTVVTDYEKADIEQLQEAGLVEFETEGKAKFISLKETVKALKGQGMTCTEK